MGSPPPWPRLTDSTVLPWRRHGILREMGKRPDSHSSRNIAFFPSAETFCRKESRRSL